MPTGLTPVFAETDTRLSLTFDIIGAKPSSVDVLLSRCYIKVNSPPRLFEADLPANIDPDDPQTLVRIGNGKVHLSLVKAPDSRHTWGGIRLPLGGWGSTGRDEVMARRAASIAERERSLAERMERRAGARVAHERAAQNEQWRLDRETREWMDKTKDAEKAHAVDRIFGATLRENGPSRGTPALEEVADGSAERPPADQKQQNGNHDSRADAESEFEVEVAPELPSVVEAPDDSIFDDDDLPPPLEDIHAPIPPPSSHHDRHPNNCTSSRCQIVDVTDQECEADSEEGVAREAKEGKAAPRAGGSVKLSFSARAHPNLPARESHPPPLPKQQVKQQHGAGGAMGERGVHEDESSPMFLKEKGDGFLRAEDFQSAVNAYTEALKIASNAACFANRSLCHLYLGNLQQCLDDARFAISVIDLASRAPEGHPPPIPRPQDAVLRARMHLRVATVFLWIGEFRKCLEQYDAALCVERGLTKDHYQMIEEDRNTIERSLKALPFKAAADSALRQSTSSSSTSAHALARRSVDLYGEALGHVQGHPVILSNRCQAHMQMGDTDQGLADGENALHTLEKWPLPTTHHPQRHPSPQCTTSAGDEPLPEALDGGLEACSPSGPVIGRGGGEVCGCRLVSGHVVERARRRVMTKLHMRLATILEQTGRIDKAIHHCKACLQLDRTHAAALEALCRLSPDDEAARLPPPPLPPNTHHDDSRPHDTTQPSPDSHHDEQADEAAEREEGEQSVAAQVASLVSTGRSMLQKDSPDYAVALEVLQHAVNVARRGRPGAGGEWSHEMVAVKYQEALALVNAALCCQKMDQHEKVIAHTDVGLELLSDLQASLAVDREAFMDAVGGDVTQGKLQQMEAACRMRRVACLKAMGRVDEAEAEKQRIRPPQPKNQ